VTVKRKVAILSPLEGMIAIAQCPPNGYVHARSPKEVRGRTIWYQHWECFHHFACRALRYFGPMDQVPLQEHWAGVTSPTAMAEAVARMYTAGQLQVIAVHDYDGKFLSECYYCTQKRLTAAAQRQNGPTKFRNGPRAA
jgi:hypothetical protein